jgi:DnaJ-class molecular chaperone
MNADFVDHYQRLGLDPLASLDEIKAAWRRLAKKHHPDRNQGDEFAHQRFAELNEAYQVLSDPQRRAAFDREYRLNHRGRSYGPGAERPTRPTAAAEGASGATNPPQRGRDLRRRLPLSLKQFRSGGRITMKLEHLGTVLNAVLPEAVWPGLELVFPGQGHPGRNGGAAGRLIVVLELELPTGCYLEKGDLHMLCPLDTLRAGLGGPVTVEHPDGRRFQIQIPPGSQDGREFRLKGMGIRHERGEGDLVCHLQLTVPAILDSASRKLAEKLLKSLGL